MNRDFDIVVFGASGFTGQYVVQELAKQNTENLRWAVAGRSEEKLQQVLQQTTKDLGQDYSDVPIIIADVKNEKSLKEMCTKTKLVLNCVGPYRFFGEPVVKACVENGSHHIDVSGEPEFLETMQYKYNEQAKQAGVFVIGTCGFDSIPADMGVVYIERKFAGQLCQVESFLTIKGGEEGLVGHYGTYQSIIYGIASEKEGNLKKLRKSLFTKPLPKVGPKLKLRGAVFYSKEMNKWSLPFLGSDPSVVRRSQRYQHEELQKPPVQYGRKLLEKYPRLFSFGMFSHDGPTKKQMKDTSFSMTFHGKGVSEDHVGEISADTNMDSQIVTRIYGPEPGYIATPICMVQAALVVLGERDAMPASGGVLTPAAAFAETTLIDRLDKTGVHFTVVEESSSHAAE